MALATVFVESKTIVEDIYLQQKEEQYHQMKYPGSPEGL